MIKHIIALTGCAHIVSREHKKVIWEHLEMVHNISMQEEKFESSSLDESGRKLLKKNLSVRT